MGVFGRANAVLLGSIVATSASANAQGSQGGTPAHEVDPVKVLWNSNFAPRTEEYYVTRLQELATDYMAANPWNGATREGIESLSKRIAELEDRIQKLAERMSAHPSHDLTPITPGNEPNALAPQLVQQLRPLEWADFASNAVERWGSLCLLMLHPKASSIIPSLTEIVEAETLATEQLSLPSVRREIVLSLANAVNFGTHHQGKGVGTCSPASCCYQWARLDPVEYCRILSELFTRGKADMRGGAELRLSPDSDLPDESDRNIVERTVQAALLDHANLSLHYDARLDRHFAPTDTDRRDPMRGGANYLMLEELQFQFWGEDRSLTVVIDSFLDSTIDRLSKRAGRLPLVSLRWGDSFHACVLLNLRVTEVNPVTGYPTAGEAIIFNPQLADAESALMAGPQRRVLDASRGIESIELETFARHLHLAENGVREHLPASMKRQPGYPPPYRVEDLIEGFGMDRLGK